MTKKYLKDISPNHLLFLITYSIKNKCPEFTLGRLINQRPRWVYDMTGVDPAVNMVNCEGWEDITNGNAACEITDCST